MIYNSQFAVLALAGLAAASASQFFQNDHEFLLDAWEGFKRDFNRVYHSSEENFRFGVFIKNLELIDQRNADEIENGGEAVHGITQFADMSPDEFSALYLGSVPPEDRADRLMADVPELPEGVTASKDWSGVLTTPVKNQGSCGSCWAFSATEQIESDSMRTLRTSYVLSPQQIVSCDNKSYGCQGGWTENAYKYVKSAGGLAQERDYRYTSPPTGTCKANKNNFKITVDKFYTLSGESSMANHVSKTGPLSVCVDASSWSTYRGGIMSTCGRRVDHCVQAVGVNTGANGYWKVRNSWGVSWGESGYIRLAYGQNTCNIANDPTYAAVRKV